MKTNAQSLRRSRLLPGGIPRYVRCYDNGGETADRFTVCFSGKAGVVRDKERQYPAQYSYLAMSSAPFSPQGVGIWQSASNQPVDTMGREKHKWYWPPAIGRKCHLGRRIAFDALPEDCRKLVLSDYREIWKLEDAA